MMRLVAVVLAPSYIVGMIWTMKWALDSRLKEWPAWHGLLAGYGWPAYWAYRVGLWLWRQTRWGRRPEPEPSWGAVSIPNISNGGGYTLSFTPTTGETREPRLPDKKEPEARTSTRPIRAYRRWQLVFDNGEPYLESLNQGVRWDGPILRADGKPHFHTPQGDSNYLGHGIYAYPLVCEPFGSLDTPGWWVAGLPPRLPSVEGEVELMGRVIRHARGYRAESARIARLWVRDLPAGMDPHDVLPKLEARYHCDVGLWTEPDLSDDNEDEDCYNDCDCAACVVEREEREEPKDSSVTVSADDLLAVMRHVDRLSGRKE